MISVEYLIECDKCGKKIAREKFIYRKDEVLLLPTKILSCLSNSDLCTRCDEKARKAIDKAFENKLR